MKRIKKILVLAMTLVMMMALNITAFAYADPAEEPTTTSGSATITIEGLTDGATVTYMQIVEPDPTTTLGWKFTTAAGTPFDLAKYAKEELTETEVMAAVEGLSPSNPGGATITVTSAGLYLIKASDPSGKYIYKPMIASVGYNFADGKASLKDATIVAKKGPAQVEKTGSQEFVEINDEIEYTIKAQIPYIPSGSTATAKFSVSDTISGAEYKLTEGKLVVSIKYGKDDDVVETTKAVEVDGNKFTINLDEVTANNNYANTDIILKYSAVVTGKIVKNTAIPVYNDNPGTEFSYEAVTGEIEITKIGDGSVPLSGAQFVIEKGGKYAQLENGVLKAWGTKQEATPITTVDGKAKAAGFDRDVTNYRVQEVVAPTGYKLDETLYAAEWTTAADKAVAQLAKAEITDTTLSTLPFTGGSGTMAFTGFGVLLMSVGAGLYFTNKKKNSSTK